PARDERELKALEAIFIWTINRTSPLHVEDTSFHAAFQAVLDNNSQPFSSYISRTLPNPGGHTLGAVCLFNYAGKNLSTDQLLGSSLLGEQLTASILEKRNAALLANIRNAFYFSDQLICITSREGFLRNINPRFVQVLGYDKYYILSKSIFELIPSEDAVTLQ